LRCSGVGLHTDILCQQMPCFVGLFCTSAPPDTSPTALRCPCCPLFQNFRSALVLRPASQICTVSSDLQRRTDEAGQDPRSLTFLLARRYDIACISRQRVSVCLSVTRRYYVKTANRRITQTTPCDSQGTLVSWLQQSLVGESTPHPFPWNLRSKWPTSFRTQRFRPACLQPIAINVNSAPSVGRSPYSTYSPKIPSAGWLPTNLSHANTDKTDGTCHCPIIVATSLLCLTDHRIAGDVPIYLKFALKVTHPFRKRWFRQFSLNSASAMRASEKSYVTPKVPQRMAQNEIFFYILRYLSYLHCR